MSAPARISKVPYRLVEFVRHLAGVIRVRDRADVGHLLASRVLNLLQELNIVFGQAVRSSALPQQCEVPERWVAVFFIALGNVGHGLQRRAADVLGIQP